VTLSARAAVRYRIVPLDPHAHTFEVRCTVADPHADGQRFRLPAWIPGSYLIREFAQHLVAVRAKAAGDALVAIDGVRATADSIDKVLTRRGAGETVEIHAFRRDELIATTLTLVAAPEDTCWLAVDANAGDAARARRDARRRAAAGS
jgi:predicted metalloprotease with PDZ domain